MRQFVTTSALLTRAILLVSVCGVMLAGVPLTVVHSHADATLGHVHDVGEHRYANEHEHDDHHDDEEFDSDSLHVHALDVVSPGITATMKIPVLLEQPQSLSPLPLDNWLPDKPVVPPFRPPIA